MRRRVARQILVDQRGVGAQGRLQIDHRRQRLVVHPDLFGNILGQVAAGRHHQDHRLAQLAHLAFGQRYLHARMEGTALDRRRRHQEWSRLPIVAEILGGEDRQDSLFGQRVALVDGGDASVSVGAAHEGRMNHPWQMNIVHEQRLAGEEARVFVARNTLAEGTGGHEALPP